MARYRAYNASKQIALPADENGALLQEANGNGANEATHVTAGTTAAMVPLQGKYVLLMWIPAFCDLSGTTVSLWSLGLSFLFGSVFLEHAPSLFPPALYFVNERVLPTPA